MAEAYMAITATIACRVDCDFCPQELLIKEYELQNNLTNISYGNPNIMDFSVFKQCIDKIPKNVPLPIASMYQAIAAGVRWAVQVPKGDVRFYL